MSKTLMVMGGSGFIGQNIAKYFLKGEYNKFKISKLILVSRSGQLNKKYKKHKNYKNITIKKIDLLKKISFLPKSDYVIFGASPTLKGIGNFKKEFENTKKIMKNFLYFLKKNKFNCKLLYISSGSVYGINKNKKKISENHKISFSKLRKLDLEKRNYALGKIDCERQLKNFSKSSKIKIIITRCFSFVDDNISLHKNYFMGNMVDNIRKSKSLNLNSKNPKGIFRSYMHCRDLSKWFLVILQNTNKKYQIYNVGSDKAETLFDISKKLSSYYDLNLNYKIPKTKLKIDDYYIPLIDKVKKYYKLKIDYSNFEAIKKSIDFK